MSQVSLIVDDESANIDIIKNLIPSEYPCKALIKRHVALKQIDKQKPNVVLFDLIMPSINGIITLTDVKKTYSETQPLMLPPLTWIMSGIKAPEQFDAVLMQIFRSR